VFSDGASSIRDYCEAAIQKGFEEIAFTDHLTVFPNGSTERHSLDVLKLENYVREIKDAYKKYRNRLVIRLGVEADYIPGNEKVLQDILESYEFDLIVGSVHFVEGMCIDSLRQKVSVENEIRKSGFDVFYSKYLTLVSRAVETGLFNVIGHMDLVRIWGFSPSNGLLDEYRVLNLAERYGMCLEVSSRGLRQPINAIYPSERIVRRARELGIPITLGTDAHLADEIDHAYDVLVKYVKSLGYSSVATFNKRKIVEKIL
jgi:histidinol-phosphatase (PHP family)